MLLRYRRRWLKDSVTVDVDLMKAASVWLVVCVGARHSRVTADVESENQRYRLRLLWTVNLKYEA